MVEHGRESRRPGWLCEYTLDWTDDSCVWQATPRPPAAAGARRFWLVQDQPLECEILTPSEHLSALTLRMVSDTGRTGLFWFLEIQDRDGTTIARRTGPASWSGGQAYLWADLRGVAVRRGQPLVLKISCSDPIEDGDIGLDLRSMDAGGYDLRPALLRFQDRRLLGERLIAPPGSPRVVLAIPAGRPASEVASAARAAAAALPGEPITLIDLDDLTAAWPRLAAADLVIFDEPEAPGGEGSRGFDALAFELYRIGCATAALDRRGLAELPAGVQANAALAGRSRAARDAQRRCRFRIHELEAIDHEQPGEPLALGAPDAADILIQLAAEQRRPTVSIVSVLYKKRNIVPTFLQHVRDQSYAGNIEVVFVDDCSPEDDVLAAEAFALRLKAEGRADRRITVLRNADNSGNCVSRLNGLAAATGDICIVIDCDCLLNRDFVAAHVFEHARPDVDAVIGPLNIESGSRDPTDLVRAMEGDPAGVLAEQAVQDPVQLDGFVNCITRNFSVKRRMLAAEPLFDVDFSYSAKPDSGFGWEDVDMGYRLYRRGAVIRYTSLAFSVHCTHPSSSSEERNAAGSIRNFARLFEKNPDLALAARRWAVDTYDRLETWRAGLSVPSGVAGETLHALFADRLKTTRPLVRALRGDGRRLRVLSYRWHAPHQYELYKLPHDFTLVTGVGGNDMINDWSYDQRPLRPNVRFRPAAEINPADFDIAVLHFDENALDAQLCNGVIPPVWGGAFRWLLAQEGLPKVAICHGTPQFEGQYGLDPARKTQFKVYEDERRRLVDALSDVKVVCNSHQAHAEWGFIDSWVIWHGFDPQEFPSGRHDLDILALSPDWHRPHYRGAWEQSEVESRLLGERRIGSAAHAGAAIDPRGGQAYAVRNFRSYVDRIGRFKTYLNTTLRSPMPRSRGEAMMTGVIPVCLRSHDVDRFIDNGVNGFVGDSAEELADFLNALHLDDDRRAIMSAAARRTAMDVFNHDNYLLSWVNLLQEAVN